MKTRRWELIIVGLLLAGAVLWLAFSFLLPKHPGGVAVVSGPAIETQRIPLDADGVYRVEAALPVTLRVKDGRIRFEASVCPDHVCEGFGWISNEGQQAVCMPAGVAVTVTENN